MKHFTLTWQLCHATPMLMVGDLQSFMECKVLNQYYYYWRSGLIRSLNVSKSCEGELNRASVGTILILCVCWGIYCTEADLNKVKDEDILSIFLSPETHFLCFSLLRLTVIWLVVNPIICFSDYIVWLENKSRYLFFCAAASPQSTG